MKLLLRKLYYREHAFCCREGRYTDDVRALLGDDADRFEIAAYTTPSMFEGVAQWNGETWHIRQDGYVWKGDNA